MASDLNEQAGLLLFGISLNATREVAPEEKVGKHARPSARARAREGPGRHLDVAGAPPPSVGGGSSHPLPRYAAVLRTTAPRADLGCTAR